MITIFNRKELLITFDIKYRSNICDILNANKIEYSVKTTNLQSAAIGGNGRERYGTFGVNSNYSYEYKIYVHKKDYEYALSLIG